MTRRGGIALLTTVLASPLFALSASAGDNGPFGDGVQQSAARAGSDGNKFVATATAFVDPDGTTHALPSDGTGAAGPSPYEYRVKRLSGICPNNSAGQPQDLVFVDTCLIADGRGAPRNMGIAFCASPNAQPVDLNDIAAQAETVTQTLTPPKPTVRIQPDGTTLVGNPTIFSGQQPAELTPPALLNPLSGRSLQLTVQPTTWTWDFGDGSPVVTTDGAPPAYHAGADTAGLLRHTYRRATDLSVTVTVRWTASYTISGVAGVRNVAASVSSTTTLRLAVREARTQLVSR
jgi:hypothetical protein